MTDGPQFARSCRRRGWRYRMQSAEQAFVEIRLADGSTCRLDLLDLGAGGLSFGLDEGGPALRVGARIDGAVVRVGKIRMTGRLRIAHMTEEFGTGTVCGAEFDPLGEADEQAMDDLIARLESAEDVQRL